MSNSACKRRQQQDVNRQDEGEKQVEEYEQAELAGIGVDGDMAHVSAYH